MLDETYWMTIQAEFSSPFISISFYASHTMHCIQFYSMQLMVCISLFAFNVMHFILKPCNTLYPSYSMHHIILKSKVHQFGCFPGRSSRHNQSNKKYMAIENKIKLVYWNFNSISFIIWIWKWEMKWEKFLKFKHHCCFNDVHAYAVLSDWQFL